MHPNPAFRNDADALAFAEAVGFAHILIVTPAGPMVVHAPVTRCSDALCFHVSRANRAFGHLPGATVLVSVSGAQGYVSPSWYPVAGDQVPTWNYVAVEIDGVAREIDEDALVAQVDALAAIHEPRAAPERPWAREKMADAVFRRMLRAIAGFEVVPLAIRTTAKLSQNKPDADRAGVIAGLRRSGQHALADAVGGLPSRS